MSTTLNTGLLRAAREEFVTQILPELASKDRYTGAMLKRALDVLLAQAESGDPEDALREAGLGDAAALAKTLRLRPAGPDPRAALRDYVGRKLAISNPRFRAEAE